MAQSLRAENIGKTRVQGFDLHTDWDNGATGVLASYTRLWPYDITVASAKNLLPGVSEHTAVAALSQKIDWLTLRWTSRYRSQLYRDHQNLVGIPAYTIHDASVDTTVKTDRAHKLQVGLSVLNVFNTMKLPIVARDTPANRGATSYSDIDGEPLPGRQWQLSLVGEFD